MLFIVLTVSGNLYPDLYQLCCLYIVRENQNLSLMEIGRPKKREAFQKKPL